MGDLGDNRFTVQLAFALLYTGVCLIVLLSAIWMGISVAGSIVSPIRKLIGAANKVSSGDLNVRVEAKGNEGDLQSLGETFNKMLVDLNQQRNRLLEANDDIDHRRKFTEAVLSGVSAGVIGVDRDGVISIFNKSADQLLSTRSKNLKVDASLHDYSKEVHDAFSEVATSARLSEIREINLIRDGVERTLIIKVTKEEAADDSLIITLDDVTSLVSAQRNSAWAEVAQRIAHEIKNPLTPIQLSAERIKRRFGKQIADDKHMFDQCTDTIVRQVEDIGRMVDEFSSFARMPKPSMAPRDLAALIRQAVFLVEVSNPPHHIYR